MVDFLRKELIHPVHRESQNVKNDLEVIGNASDDPWIDITDDFGRTRLVRQSAAMKMEKDKEDERIRVVEEENRMDREKSVELQLRELATETNASNTSNVREEVDRSKSGHHYDNSKEIRTMGVGFYQFSSNTEDRSKQMDDLRDLRDSTIFTRNNKLKLKDAKKEAREERMRIILEKAKKQTL